MPEQSLLGIRGFLIDAPSPDSLRGIRGGAIVIEDGLIADRGSSEEVTARNAGRTIKWRHSPDAIVVPGLIDLHAQVAQYPLMGRFSQKAADLLEKEFRAKSASQQASAFFADLARHGTTCAMLYASHFEDSCKEVFAAAENAGMRVVLGTVMEDAATGNTAKLLEQAETLCRRWHRRENGRLEFAVGVRSPWKCSGELLRGAAELAAKTGAFIHANLSATAGEADEYRARFPDPAAIVDLLGEHGLLGPRSVFAHALHLTEPGIAMLAGSQSSVAHCPTADFFSAVGIAPLDRLRGAGIRAGLGSGIGAGPDLNLWHVMRAAVESQRARSYFAPEIPALSVTEAFHMATQGAAEILGKGRSVGSFEIGKEADLVVMDLARTLPLKSRSNPHAAMTAEEVLSLLIFRGGPGAVLETLVRGLPVHHAPDGFLL